MTPIHASTTPYFSTSRPTLGPCRRDCATVGAGSSFGGAAAVPLDLMAGPSGNQLRRPVVLGQLITCAQPDLVGRRDRREDSLECPRPEGLSAQEGVQRERQHLAGLCRLLEELLELVEDDALVVLPRQGRV